MNSLESDLRFQYGRSIVERTSVGVDLEEVRHVLDQFMQKYPLQQDQLCLTVRHAEDPDVYDGIGSLVDRQTGHIHKNESEFRTLHPDLMGTIIENMMKEVQVSLGFRVGRTRIMRLQPKRCYSFHFDLNPRIHLALETNEHSFLIIPPSVFFHVPTDGHFYYFDTRHRHTAINGGEKDRLHLVATVLAMPCEDDSTQ